jgi:hypothetical protein
MSKSLKLLSFLYVIAFLGTGSLMVVIVNADESSAPWIATLVRNHGIVFAWHLVCWMILGMFTNYYWDLFNIGKGIAAMQAPRILLPLMVSPFVFLPTYNLWLASSSQSYLLFAVIAIQSGFFWQALFTKLSPLERATNIPWTAGGGGRSAAKATAASAQDAG